MYKMDCFEIRVNNNIILLPKNSNLEINIKTPNINSESPHYAKPKLWMPQNVSFQQKRGLRSSSASRKKRYASFLEDSGSGGDWKGIFQEEFSKEPVKKE